jgi:hypothetical protein
VAGTGAGLLALWLTHPYSAIAGAAIVAAALIGERILRGKLGRQRLVAIALATLPALAVAAAVSLWQLRDDVFRRSAGNLLGPQAPSIFWYPLALGLVGVLALPGWRRWVREQYPWRYAIGGWFYAVVLLATSRVLNGYHFLPFLFLPVAVFAAPVVSEVFERQRRSPALRLGAAALLFASTPAMATWAVREAAGHTIPKALGRLLATLERVPPGNVLCAPDVGNLVPAFGPHRVYVGQWFMTPEYVARSQAWARLVDQGGEEELRRVVAAERIDYLVVPAPRAESIAGALALERPRVEVHGTLALLRLRGR